MKLWKLVAGEWASPAIATTWTWTRLKKLNRYLKKNSREGLVKTREILQKAGAHYVIDTFDQLVDVVEDINLRLSRGERP